MSRARTVEEVRKSLAETRGRDPIYPEMLRMAAAVSGRDPSELAMELPSCAGCGETIAEGTICTDCQP